MKQFILNNADREFKLKSIRFSSSDSAILEEFLTVLQDLIPKSREFYSAKNVRLEEGEKDHVICRQLL